jgi:hypothetical protein
MADSVYTRRLRAAADLMEKSPWVQHIEYESDTGAVCLTGAVRRCAPRTGDEYLIEAVLRLRDRAESWNDQLDPDCGKKQVVDYLSRAEITDDDIEGTFGPRWQHVVALVRQAASMTGPQYMKIHTDLRKQLEEGDVEDDCWPLVSGARGDEFFPYWERARGAVQAAIMENRALPNRLRQMTGAVEAGQMAAGAVVLGRQWYADHYEGQVDLYELKIRAWATVFPEVKAWG